jgi:RNA polymerase sigma factor (sigma-70 family)
MEKNIIETTSEFVSPQERTQLVRLCATLTADREAAEDLAQEALFEAWRSRDSLRDPERRPQWLVGIARNICLRWQRQRGRDAAHLSKPHIILPAQDDPFADLKDTLADDFDIEVELERKELAQLLDRALALLPPETRLILVKRYIEESPLAEVAEQLGTNASAVAMRLQRGKLALRRLLISDMQHELASYGLSSASDEWEITPIWCNLCGQYRLLGRRDPDHGVLLLKCPKCSPEPDEVVSKNMHLAALRGVRGYKPLYSRLGAWCNHTYRTGLREGTIACEDCGRMQDVSICTLQELPDWALRDRERSPIWVGNYLARGERLISILCPSCQNSSLTTLDGLTLSLPEARQFHQSHPRIRTLPRQQIEAEGRPALLTRFESVTDSAMLTVVSDYATYEVLRIYFQYPQTDRNPISARPPMP